MSEKLVRKKIRIWKIFFPKKWLANDTKNKKCLLVFGLTLLTLNSNCWCDVTMACDNGLDLMRFLVTFCYPSSDKDFFLRDKKVYLRLEEVIVF